MKTFDIRIQEAEAVSGWSQVDLSGFLDAHTVREFDERMAKLVNDGQTHIALGLQNLNYISSAGVASLMGLMQKLRSASGNLAIVHPSDKVFHVLKTLGFTNIFQIVNDVSELKPVIR